MRTNTNASQTLPLLRALSDFGAGVLLPLMVPTIALGGLVTLFVGPLWLLARTLGAL
jgi:hypothetical protein